MKTRLPFVFILITIVLDAVGFGLIMPLMPTLIQDVSGGDLAHAAIWGGVLTTAFALMQFLFSPLLGNLSDSYGRRPVLLISLAILTIDYLIMAVASTMWLLFLGRILGGITSATHSTANAFVADISAPEKKAANFGLVSAAFGFGFVFGPSLGGLLAGFGPRVPFYVAAALAGANAIFGYFILPETVTEKTRRPFEWKRSNPVGAFKAMSQFTGLRMLFLVMFAYQVAFFVYPSVWAYFTQEKFGWGPQIIGYSLTVFGLAMAITQGVLIRPILARIGEEKTALVSLLIGSASLAGIAMVPSGWLVIILTPLAALGAIAAPALMGIMSREVSDNQQGELQGLITSINAVALLLSPLVMTQLFSLFSKPNAPIYLPSAPFLLASGLMAIGLLILTFHRKKTQ